MEISQKKLSVLKYETLLKELSTLHNQPICMKMGSSRKEEVYVLNDQYVAI